jgi:DNA-binding PadR family transcriptional regulator
VRLTSTSYAVLGLLSIRPWSPYELVQHMKKRSTVHFIWPRAESRVYEEPKRLTAAGLATATSDPRGQQDRTVYAITPAGMDALKAWLAEPGGRVTVEAEPLLKVLFAEQGSQEELLDNVRAVGLWATGEMDRMLANATQALTPEGTPFPRRMHLSGLVSDFVLRVSEAVVEWSQAAEAQIEQWDGTGTDAARVEESLQLARMWLDRAKRLPPT